MNFCPECFHNSGLKRRVRVLRAANSTSDRCSFHPTRKGIPSAILTPLVDEVFRQHYYLIDDNWDQSGDDLATLVSAITDAASDEITTALVNELIEQDDYWPPDGSDGFYDEVASYGRDHNIQNIHSEKWHEFRTSIQYGQRFFNEDALSLLDEIFDNIQKQLTSGRKGPVHRLKPGQPEARFFRARLANDAELRGFMRAHVASALGPPPPRARRPGRMNPSGIAVFYGALDVNTCIAELRPAVGSIVASAEFELTKPIWVLDTTMFKGPPKNLSWFSPDYINRTAQWQFMQRFRQEIAIPFSPDDEHLDYIPTQAVAEYLCRRHMFNYRGEEQHIEAIIFQSAQNPSGKNIVFLGEAASVQVHPEDMEPDKPSTGDSILDRMDEIIRSSRKPSAIAIRPKTLKFHSVRSAYYQATPFDDLEEDDLPF